MKTDLQPKTAMTFYAVGMGMSLWGYFNPAVLMFDFVSIFVIALFTSIFGEP